MELSPSDEPLLPPDRESQQLVCQNALPTLECREIVYRTVSTDYWIKKKTGRITRHAFLRREADINGLSVDIASKRNLQNCIDSPRTKKCFAIVSLHTGKVRDLELDVIPDGEDHANIDKLPPSGCSEEEEKRRNDLADALAEQCYPQYYSDEIKQKHKLENVALGKHNPTD